MSGESGAARQVGIVGLGKIGGFVGRALAGAGWQPLGYDVRPEAASQFADAVESLASPRAVAEQAEIVLVAVFDDDQVRDVLAGEQGILSAQPLPKVVVILSTVTLDTVRWAAGQSAEHGVELLDCGVTGGHGLRNHGQIVVLAGGSDQGLDLARPALEVFAAPLLHMGPLGAGMQAKLARNLIHYSCWYAAWEGALLAAAAGIDVAKLVEACRASDAWSGGATGLLGRGIGPAPADPADEEALAGRRSTVGYAHKDLGYALSLGEELGIPLPGAELVLERIDYALGLADPLARELAQ